MDSKEVFRQLFDRLTAKPEIQRSRMFGFESLTVKGKTFALLDGDSMVFKLGQAALEDALKLEGVKRWNPYGHEKKMWVQVPGAHAAKWQDMAESARGYVEGLIISS